MSLRPHVISQGEFLSRLAHDRGFDADAVWNDPHNAELRRGRTHMDLLAPGDVVYVPVPDPPREQPVSVGVVNRFRAQVPRVPIRLVMQGADGAPLAGERYTVEGLGPRPVTGTTDGAGALTIDAPIHARELRLSFNEGRTVIPVRVGHMDPIAESSGVHARLLNLGYLHEAGGTGAERDEALAEALRRFQRERGLPVTGAVDDATRDVLRSAHGC